MSRYSNDMNWRYKRMAFLNSVEPLKRDWVNDAACKDGKIDFFPKISKTIGTMEMEETLRRANTKHRINRQREIAEAPLNLCATCPVIRECRQDHLHEEYGVWFGTVPAERNSKYHANCECVACSTRRISRRAKPNDNMVCTETQTDEGYQSNAG
jgi:hypothetical protein